MILLEQALSGKLISDEIQYASGSLTEIIDADTDSYTKDNDQNIDLRVSRILNFPVKHKEQYKHETVLTAFIQLVNEEGKYFK